MIPHRKIAIVIDGQDPGGTDEIGALVANQFTENGIPCCVYLDGSTRKCEFVKSRLNSRIQIHKITFVPPFVRKLYNSPNRFLRRIAAIIYQYFNVLWLPSIAFSLYRRIKQDHITQLMIHSGGWPGPRSTLPIVIVSWLTGKKLHIIIHNYVALSLGCTFFQTAGLEFLIRFLKIPIATVSNDLKNHLETKTYLKNCVILRNCIRNEFFLNPTPPQLPSENQPIVLITVGTLDQRRSQRTVIEAIELLPVELKKRIRYWIVGEGTELNSLKQRVKQYQLGDQIRFFGFEPNIIPLLDTAHLYINPVLSYESFGLGMYEAMARGLPVLGSKICAVPECIKNKYNGELFEPGSASDLSQKMIEILTTNNLYKTTQLGAIQTAQSAKPEQLLNEYLTFMSQ